MDDLQSQLASLSNGLGTKSNKRLPASKPTPEIPARAGTADRVVIPSSGSGSAINMTLTGPKTYQSTDGLITLSFPNSAAVVIDATTLTLPAIISTP